MKILNIKAFMVITLFLASIFATPIMVVGSTNNDDLNPDQIDNPKDLIGGFQEGFGAIFGSMGYGGLLLGRVFELLLLQIFTDFENSEILPGVYEISATIEQTVNGSRYFREDEIQYYIVPYEYFEFYPQFITNELGYPYCKVNKTGLYEFNLTVGVGITFIIWDHDGSFIRAVEKLLDFFRRYLSYEDSPEEIPEDLIQEGVELITWVLIHINDIFTGDELFILNPISWQKLEIKTGPDFSIVKTMMVTGPDWAIDGDDIEIESLSGDIDGPAVLDVWNATAKENKDSYMEWLLTKTDDADLVETIYTSFTFDVIQLWVKNFEIHINVAEILNLISDGGTVDPAAIFEGLDIEFYLFTHHLTGAFLYEDKVPDGKITTEYVRVNDTDGDPILVDGREAYVPRTNEITHRLILGSVDNFAFEEPEVITGTNTFSWGLTLNQAEIYPVPVGVDLDSYLGAVPESLAYIHFGFTFEPIETELATEDGGTVPVLHGALKLDQLFAPWNDPDAPVPNNNITRLDLAIIYVSTVLHFHLTVDTIGEDGDIILDPTQDYENTTHSLKIGNYLGRSISGKLDFVDIAGPYYEYGTESSKIQADASTAILPVALFESETKAHETFEGTPDEVKSFGADIQLNVSFNVMVYAVCFPMFENGNGIWHDPTFSVYMIFEAKGFWAIILLVAGVGLVGVATILIKRRKDARF